MANSAKKSLFFSAVAATLLAALPMSKAISMCCVGDVAVAPGPYEAVDTSTLSADEFQRKDYGCETCCQGYASGTKYGRVGTDLVFEVESPGIFTAGYGAGPSSAVAGDATLRVEFSQEQVLLNAGSVSTVYKRSTFDPDGWNERTETCREGVAPGFRFGSFPLGTMIAPMCAHAAGVLRTAEAWDIMFCDNGNDPEPSVSYDGCYAELITKFGAYRADEDNYACSQETLDSIDAKCRGEPLMCQSYIPSLTDHGILVSGMTDIEFEQDMVWKNVSNGAVLGTDWGMQKVFIGAQTVPGGRDTRCFHTDEDKMTGCTDSTVSENGIKFQLELNQQGKYPHGESTFWDACTGDDDTCATCFAVKVTVNEGDFAVTSHNASDEAVSWTLEDSETGETYDFTFAFESLYNRNDQGSGGGGNEDDGIPVDAPTDFAKAIIVTTTEAKSGSVYVCAPKGDYDPSVSDSHTIFLYDPEVRVTKTTAPSDDGEDSSSGSTVSSLAARMLTTVALGAAAVHVAF